MWTRLVSGIVIAAAPLGAQAASPLPARDCGRGVAIRCGPKVITEATYSLRLSGKPEGSNHSGGPEFGNIAASFGVVTPVAERIGVGAVATVGLWSGLYLGLGARLRFQASTKVAVDVTPTYLVARGGDPGHPRGMLDAAVMFSDQVGISAQLTSFHVTSYDYTDPYNTTMTTRNRMALFTGLRLGSKPGRYGILADAVALAGVFGLYAVACHNGACD